MTNPTDVPLNTSQSTGANAAYTPGQQPVNNVTPQTQSATNALISNPGVNINQNGMGLGSALLNPPPLRTFVYSPNVKIVIGHDIRQFDVSADVVRCTLMRQENSVSTFMFTLHNKDLRYTPPDGNPPFSRMDRISVQMKKVEWVQVFAGYLDTIPYKQLYPGEVTFKASCTLKRLMHTWWNPALPASAALLDQWDTNTINGDGQLGTTDGGMGNLLRRLLMLVGGWDPLQIHIQNFPTLFFAFMTSQVNASQQTTQGNVANFQQMLMGSNYAGAPGAAAGSNPNAGPAGPYVGGTGPVAGLAGVGSGMAFYVTQIIQACDNKGLGPTVSDNNMGANLSQLGQTGEQAASGSYGAQGETKAWQQVQTLGQNIQDTNRSSDAAILGVAAAMAEGGGTIRNSYNPAVPGSESFPNDGPSTNGQCVGIFQLPPSAEWGNLAQRMNPLQAATMFFDHVNAIGGWRQMDPAAVIQQVMASANSATFSASIDQATSLVQGYRTGSSGAGSTVSQAAPSAYAGVNGTSAGAAASSVGASATAGSAPGVSPAAVATGVSNSINVGTNVASGANPVSAMDPHPNSEGAIRFAMTKIGLPYIWGGNGPEGYDCSGLWVAAFKSIGISLPRTTEAMLGSMAHIPAASIQRGDLIFPHSGHVQGWLGDGTVLEAQQTGVPIKISKAGNPASAAGVIRVCQNGGPSSTAAFNPPETMGPGTAPSALSQQSGALGAGSGGGTDGASANLFAMQFSPGMFASDVAGMLAGERAFIDGQPLINIIQAIAQAGLRSWMSAPTGEFMAWYPDYWGMDGKPAVYILRDIELVDCHIDFSDDPLTTHVYVAGDYTMVGQGDSVQGWIDTAGICSVEDTWLYERLIAAAPAGLEQYIGPEMMQRYGIRPLQHQAAMAGSHELEFLLACYMFMQKYAEQYQTQISMTFMPELIPGMRVQLDQHNLEVYVTGVTHQCDFSAGFATTATIMAPSSPLKKQLMLSVNTATTPFSIPGSAIPNEVSGAVTAFHNPSNMTNSQDLAPTLPQAT